MIRLLVKDKKGILMGCKDIQQVFSEKKTRITNSVVVRIPIDVKGNATKLELVDEAKKPLLIGKLKNSVRCEQGDTIKFNKGTIVLLEDSTI